MAVIALRYAGSPDISRPDWPLRDLDGSELRHLAAVAKVGFGDIVERALATGLFTAVDDEASARNDAPAAEPTLADQTNAELAELAAGLGIEVPKKATKAVLVALVEAEHMRLAEEAAAAQAAETSSSGEGNQGGSEPADDPDATATGEAGTPPSEGDEA